MRAKRITNLSAIAWSGIILLHSSGLAACAQESATQAADLSLSERIEASTNAALSREIELERWMLQYKAFATHEPHWRHFRWFAMQDAAAGLYLSSQIVLLRDASRSLKDPQNSQVRTLREGNVLGLIGSTLEGGSSGIELGSNALIAIKNKRLKKDPVAAKRIAIQRLSDIDALLKQRQDLVAQGQLGNRAEIYAAEGNLLQQCRDACALEFADIYGDIRAYQPSSNIYYVIDVVGSSAYVASYILGLKGLRSDRFNGPSLISAIVADSIFIPLSQVYAYSYKWLFKHSRNKFMHEIDQQDYDARGKEKESLAQLQTAINAAAAKDALLSSRLAVYSLWSKRYESFLEKREIDVRRLDRVARQSNWSGPPISGAFLAADIMGLNAQYNLKRNARASAANTFAGLIGTTAASTADFGLTTYWYCDDLRHNRNLRKQHAMPSDLMTQRLRTLDDLESVLNQK